jgi:hypothetical protein
MKIRIRYFLLVLVIVFIIGYIVGWLWPIHSVMYQLSEEPVDKGVNLSNLIAIFAAFFTLMAVVVALFKDEIVGNFKSVDVTEDLLSSSVEEYLNENQGGGDPTVVKYYNQIFFKNRGNVNALDCELTVESIDFKSRTDLHYKPVSVAKRKVLLGGLERTYIPKDGGKRETDLLEIMVSEEPDGNKKTQLLIANNPVAAKAGTWIVEYCINMSNAAVRHCKFEISWDGVWHDHKNNMQIEIKKI